MIINPYAYGGAPAGVNALILAAGPTNYWRHAESSGLTMEDEVAADGVYIAAATPHAAIYAGGPTCMMSDTATSAHGNSTEFPATLNEMTLIDFIQFPAVTSFRPVGANRDNTGQVKYQWRTNGTALEFVRVNEFIGPTEVFSEPSVVVAGVTAFLAVTIGTTAGGMSPIKMYKNGVLIHTGSMTACNFGGAGDAFQVGKFSGAYYSDGYHSETAVFDYELSAGQLLAIASAAGL